MAVLDFPTTQGFKGATFSLWVETSERAFKGFFTGNRTQRSNAADRLCCQVTLPPVGNAVQAAAREAFVLGLRSTGDFVRFGMPHRPVPLGTMRGSATVAANVLAGARAISLSNARAGNNLLRKLEQLWQFGSSGWSLQNCTITANSAADPVGGTTAWTLTRTATGNHYAFQVAALASTANRTATAVVWLKAGTLTGNVTLRLRDGAGITDVGVKTVTPTSVWTPYIVSGTFGGASAANIQLTIDPVNDAGSAGDTLLVWNADIRLLTGVDTNCVTWADSAARPVGMPGAADEVIRSSTGDAFTGWAYPTTSHALQTYTFSVWLKAGSYAGTVNLVIRDGAFSIVGLSTVSLPVDWQRYSVTATFGAAPAAGVLAYIDQAEGGPIGEAFFRYGELLQPGASVTDYSPWPTAEAGDFIGVGGNLLQVAAPAVGDSTGALALQLTTPSQKAITAGAAAVLSAPTGVWELEDTGLQVDYSAPIIQGPMVLRFRQVPQ